VAAESLNDEPLAGELMAAFRASDAAAAEVLATQLLPLVTRLVRRLTAWSDDADDLVQETLVTALAKRSTFRGEARLETWITRIAINCCRSHVRKQWLRSKLLQAWVQRREPPVPVPGADSIFQCDERAAAVRAAVSRLPARSREAVVLCYLEGMTIDEAAAALGVRRGSVEVRLSRARAQLRTILSAEVSSEELVSGGSHECVAGK
jgi:RNA polymerase sigma-70 factor (ECF subfamily)